MYLLRMILPILKQTITALKNSKIHVYTPRERSSGGYIGITLSVHLSVRLSVQIRVCFFMVWHWLTIFGTWVYHHETMCRVHSWSRYDLELWSQGQIYRVFDMFSCQANNFFLVWHWPTIFGTWVYHHKKMCRVHSWSRYDLEVWPQGQIYRGFDMFSCPAYNFFLVWHWPTIFGTWVYHHKCRVHSWSRLDVDLWPPGKFIGFCHVFMSNL